MRRNSGLMQVVLIISAWLVMSYSLSAQDMKRALSDMKERMKSSAQLQIAMNVKVFEKDDKKILLYQDKISVKRDGNKCLYRYSNSDFLMNDKFMVQVDMEGKEITWAYREKADDKSMSQYINFNIDSLLMDYAKTEYIGSDKTEEHYRATPKGGDMSQVDLYFNLATHMLSQLNYKYINGQFVTITFNELNVHPQFEPSVFNEGNYLTVKGTIAKGNGEYATFSTTNSDTQKHSK